MTRIIWDSIKDKLILPFLDIELKTFDLGIEYRDETNDQVTIDCANAIKQYNVGIKCATISELEVWLFSWHKKLKYLWFQLLMKLASKSLISSRCGSHQMELSVTSSAEPSSVKQLFARMWVNFDLKNSLKLFFSGFKIPRLVPGWEKPIIIGRHAHGDQYKATDFLVPKAGRLEMVFVPSDGSEKTVYVVNDYKGPGVAMVRKKFKFS